MNSLIYYNDRTKRQLVVACDKIKNHIYTSLSNLKAEAWMTQEPVPFNQRMQEGEHREIAIGEKWGNLFDCAWFRFTGQVPPEAKSKKVVLMIDLNGEGCVFDNEGCPIRGLTNINSRFDKSLGLPGKRILQFLDAAEGGEAVDIWVDAGCNDLFGDYQDNGTLRQACVAICNDDLRSLYYDYYVLLNLMENLPSDSARYVKIFNALYEVSVIMNKYSADEIQRARDVIKPELDKKGGDASLEISAIGHSHLDLAWLWPIRETIRKGARTFSTVLELMNRYPDYVYGSSQPQLYQWIKDNYPLLYEKIKVRVKEGRWEAQGAMWVEADVNVSGGEALVRQILYGKRFFKEEFDEDMKILWLPDAFGFSAAIPQLLKKSGVDYFLTMKLSWNEYNKFPHHSFNWIGIDGSKVLAHMLPEGTYNGPATPASIRKIERGYIEKGVSDNTMMLYGIGDGGGGPGSEHLERLKRVKDLNGIVPVKQEKAVDFFKKLEVNSPKYCNWVGELYLEKHQGTFTTQAKNKWYNRKMEIALREAEFASICAFLHANAPYESGKLEEIWKEALLYQFHDILPGSSINRVYDESVERYGILLDQVNDIIDDSYKAIGKSIPIKDNKNPYLIFNSLSWARDEWVKINGNWLKVSVPSMGYSVVDAEDAQKGAAKRQLCVNTDVSTGINTDEPVIENKYLKVKFNNDGSISGIYDKECNCEVLAEDFASNRFSIYKDEGNAWDFSVYYNDNYLDCFKLISNEIIIDGPNTVMRQNYEYGKSTLTQDIILQEGSKRLDFVTEVNWQESLKMLRTSFAVNISSDNVTCNIQYGSVKRPTHENTSWDRAKSEICAHKWIDLSRRDYGVSLMNDSKYGHKVKGNIMDLNLLRSSQTPAKNADKGNHIFTYAIYPHKGDEIEGEVNKRAYELNMPLKISQLNLSRNEEPAAGLILPSQKSYVEVDSDNIIVEAVKKAEDSDDIIIRLYESCGLSKKATLNLGFNAKKVQLVNLMEEYEGDINIEDGNKVTLKFRPFDILTLKIEG